MNSCGSNEPCIHWAMYGYYLANTSEQSCAQRKCGVPLLLLSNLFIILLLSHVKCLCIDNICKFVDRSWELLTPKEKSTTSQLLSQVPVVRPIWPCWSRVYLDGMSNASVSRNDASI